MNNSEQIRVAIVDDHQIVIDGLVAALHNCPSVQIVATATDGPAMLEQMAALQIDILLTDIIMPIMSGPQLCSKVKMLFPEVAIIALSMNEECSVIRELIEQKVINGYLLKYCDIHELIRAMQIVFHGATYFQEGVVDRLEAYDQYQNNAYQARLTNREKQIICLMEKDFSNKEIATQLNISVRTVETHRKNIFRKTGANNLLSLVKWAYEHKILLP